MTDSFHYSTTFILDKAHFHECYSNSVVKARPIVAYRKAMALSLVGIGILLLTELDAYLGFFILALGIVEALGCRFAQPWWVTRQIFGRSGNSEVTLTIDEQGIHTDSAHVNSAILWGDVNDVTETTDGLLVLHSQGGGQGKSYISVKCLSDEAKAFLLSKV